MFTVVTGPPCGGKSTHVREHAKPGDLIVDLDLIALALSHNQTPTHEHTAEASHLAIGARFGVLARIPDVLGSANVWLIDTKPTRRAWQDYRAAGAVVVTCDPGYAVCVERAKRERPARWLAIIDNYYQADQ